MSKDYIMDKYSNLFNSIETELEEEIKDIQVVSTLKEKKTNVSTEDLIIKTQSLTIVIDLINNNWDITVKNFSKERCEILAEILE